MTKEQIKTVNNFNEFTLKEKGSEFIAKVYPIDSEQSALNELQTIRKKYFDASHHCFAYRLISDLTKYSDDGEPNGSAGIRILNAIDHFDITNVLVAVVRYFGGTKLGVGPLGKAYYNASIQALSSLKIVELDLFQEIQISTDFTNINYVHRLINQYSAMIVKSDYSSKATFICLIKPSILQNITLELTNLSKGQIVIDPKEVYKYK
jgi:uncharacterized YigZ family protein